MPSDHLQVSRFGLAESAGRRFWYRLIETFFRRPLMYLIPFVVLAAVGAVSLTRVQSQFESSGVLSVSSGTLLGDLSSVRGTNNYSYETPAALTARKMNELLRTDVFVQIVAERAGLGDAIAANQLTLGDVRATTFAVADGDTLLAVKSTAPSPQGAYELVTATIDSYTEWVLKDEISDSEAAENFYAKLVTDRAKQVRDAKEELDRYLIANPVVDEIDRPIEQSLRIQALNDALVRAQDQFDTAETGVETSKLESERARSESDQRLRVVDAPQIPDSPESALLEKALRLVIFMVLGLILGLSFLVIAALLDRRVRSQDDIEMIPGLEVVGVIPLIVKGRRGSRRNKRSRATDATVVAAT